MFGHRRAKICTWDSTPGSKGLKLQAQFEGIGDLVWDATWLSQNKVAVGTAQGFVEVYTEADVGKQWVRSHHVLCTARCILYSLAFSPLVDENKITLASGTVFGEIILWDGASQDGEPDQRLEGHHGPVFRVSWNAQANKLCSVGDDRTVRIWTSEAGKFVETWKSFGHNARIWDCVFVPALDAVATVGEDRQVRVWDAKNGDALAIFEAHFGRHIWRCALLSTNGACVLATAGGDSGLKVFDLLREVQSRIHMRTLLCNEQDKATSEPEEGIEVAQGSKRKRRKGAQVTVTHIYPLPVTSAQVNPSQLLVLASTGAIYSVNGAQTIHMGQQQNKEKEGHWVALYTPTSEEERYKPFTVYVQANGDVFVGIQRGHIILFRDSTAAFNTTGGLERIGMASAFTDPVASVAQVLPCANGRTLVGTPSGTGKISVWDLAVAKEESSCVSLSPRFNTNAEAVQVMVYTCMLELPEQQTIVLGDSRGSLHWFNLEQEGHHVETLSRAHGACKVACLKLHDGALFSGGHNCTIIKFNPRIENGIVVGLDPIWVVRLAHVLDQVNDMTWSKTGDLIAAGFQYTDYVVWNVSTHTPLLRDRCGGWRRPGTVVLGADPFGECAMFYSESSQEHRDRGAEPDEIAIHRVGRQASALGQRFGAGHSLGEVFHSRSTWVSQWLPAPFQNFMVVGCEDGLLSLVKMESTVQAGEQPGASTYVGLGDAQINLENDLPTNSLQLHVVAQRQRERSVRCACVLQGLEGFPVVFITGSSNQVLRAWHVDPQAAKDDGLVLLAETQPVDEVDGDGAEGTDGVAASHRVLGLFGHDNLIVVGTSTGQLVLYELKLDAANVGEDDMPPLKSRLDARVPMRGRFVQLQELGGVVHINASDEDAASTMAKPVRCLSGHYDVKTDTLWLFVGRTNGFVEIWAGAQGGRGEWTKLFAERRHSMGVNCISVARSSSTSTIMIIATGGDDQGMNVMQWCLSTEREVGQRLNVLGADGSALRGIHTDGERIWACGLNQRLRCWRIQDLKQDETTHNEGKVIQLIPHDLTSYEAGNANLLQLENESLVDIADVNCLSVQADREDPCVVIGGVGVRVL